MNYNILHLIDSVNPVNFGVWNAALINSSELCKIGIKSYAAIPEEENLDYKDVEKIPFKNYESLLAYMLSENLAAATTIVISHGCWRWPTALGAKLHSMGFKWIAVPQGMLEPWSRSQKSVKKTIYYNLVEKRRLKKASAIRAVSTPEYNNLIKDFGDKVHLIPNGINQPSGNLHKPENQEKNLRFLFMARLHHKKGILPLIQGWVASPLNNSKKYELIIAGPDNGEYNKISAFIENSANIKYVGAVYDEKKSQLLKESHVYVLPSYSEGFPSSVLEAMSYGLFPLISEGCNFPEAFENNVALPLEPDPKKIKNSLKAVAAIPFSKLVEDGQKSRKFILEKYTIVEISKQLDYLNQSLFLS